MPFAPRLSSSPTIEELKAYYEWLDKPQEMKSASPPPPEGVDDKVWKAMIEATSLPPLPEGVDSVEELLKLADQDDPFAQSRGMVRLSPFPPITQVDGGGRPGKDRNWPRRQEAAGRSRSTWFPPFLLASLVVAVAVLLLWQGEHNRGRRFCSSQGAIGCPG